MTEENYQDFLLDFGILDYLPHQGFNNPTNEEFFRYLIDIFNNNWKLVGKSNLHQIAFKAFYDLYLTFIYVKVWQVKEHKNKEFIRVLSTLSPSNQNFLLDFKAPTSLKSSWSSNIFDLSSLNDGEVFKFLKLFEYHRNEIDEFCKYLVVRNHCSHPSGFVQYQPRTLENNMFELVSFCKKIVIKFQPTLNDIFEQFLIENNDLNDDENIFNDRFVKPNYISIAEISYLQQFDIARMEKLKDYKQIKLFFMLFQKKYKGYSNSESITV